VLLIVVFAPDILRNLSNTARPNERAILLVKHISEVVMTQQVPTPTTFGPYSPIRQAGDTYYISGQIGVDPQTHAAEENIARQTICALENLGEVLRDAGLEYRDIVRTTIYLTDMADFATVNDIYVGYFPEPRPARTCVEVAGLPRVAGDTQLCIEIDAIAVRRPS
jgi:2-iminobutanoate/2-iminopropanoate deaminase